MLARTDTIDYTLPRTRGDEPPAQASGEVDVISTPHTRG